MAINSLGELSVFLNLDMRGFVAGMSTASAQIKGLGATITRNSVAMTRMGKTMMMAGTAVAAGFGMAVKAAKDFEYQMSKVNSMLADSEKHYLPQFSKQIRDMSVKYGLSTKTLTDGLYDVLSAQMGAANAMKFMNEAAKAAIGGFTDVNIAVSAMLTMMKTYKNEIHSATEAADWLQAVVERGRLTFEQLSTTLGTTASLASKAGMDLGDYGATLAVLTKGGLSAERAQTALKGILRSVLKTQEEGIAVGKKLGVTWAVEAIQAGNFTETLLKLSKANIDQLTALAPNIRGMLGLAITTANANEILKDRIRILDAAGLNEKKYREAQETLKVQFDRLKQSLIAGSVIIGEKLVPTIKELVAKIIEVTGKIRDFADSHKELFEWTIKTTTKISLLGIALGGVLLIVPKLNTALKGLIATAAILEKHPMLLSMIALMYSYKNLLNFQNAVIGAIKAHNLKLKSEKRALDAVNKSVDDYDKLIESVRNHLKEMTDAEREVPPSVKMAADMLEETIKKYKKKEATIEEVIAAMLRYKDALDGIYTVQKKNNVEAEKTISLREKDYELYRKIEDIKHKITLMGLEGIDKEYNQELYRHKARLEHIENEFKDKKDIAEQLEELENQLHRKIMQRIKEEKDMTIQMLKTLESSFKSTFGATLAGEVANFKEFFERIIHSMRRRWADLMADMVTDWIKSQIVMKRTDSSGGGLFGGIMKLVGAVAGIGSISTATSASVGGALLSDSGNPLGYTGLTGVPGFASGGMVPATGLYKLHEGEQVISREPGGNEGVTIINVLSPDLITSAMATQRGQKVIVNTISQDLLRNGQTRKIFKGI